jgi:iron complex outermembrane receptor protein
MKDAGFLRFCVSRLVEASRHSSALVVFIALLFTASPFARAEELADLSLEDLANLEVTSVSRRAERLADAPASLFVITGEDIRRSGVTSLPEALRLAPNLEVARVDAGRYAISARGFNNSVGNKLLVLIDGRTIYTPLFSGVFWDAQDTLLEDIERIEVISGPGATQWGANAVNGVINVITRRASSTVGTVAEAGFGNRERGIAARQGFALDDGAMRVYGKFFDRDHSVRADGAVVPLIGHNGQAGFRGDWGTVASGFTHQGDAYRGAIQQASGRDTRISGGNLLGRWNRQFGSADRLQVQAYVDNTVRDVPGTFGERLNTVDLDLQHGFQAIPGHAVTWGGGHRRSYDQVSNTGMLAFIPASTTLKWTNVFLQDEIALREDLHLTVGGKVEWNPYTGGEFLPSVRLAWKPQPNQLVWGALSRAVRAPSRLDRELFIPGQPPFFLAGGPDFRSEVAKVFELGYRAQPSPRLSYSVTGFYALYDHLRTLEPAGGGALVLGNKMEGKTRGIETWGTYQVFSSWRLSAAAVFLTEDLRLRPDSGDTTGVAAAGNDPKRQFTMRSSFDLSSEQQLDIMARHVGELPNPRVPAYTAIDARFAWRFQRDLELSATAQNMFDRRHPEFGAAASRSEIERGIFLRLKWSP